MAFSVVDMAFFVVDMAFSVAEIQDAFGVVVDSMADAVGESTVDGELVVHCYYNQLMLES